MSRKKETQYSITQLNSSEPSCTIPPGQWPGIVDARSFASDANEAHDAPSRTADTSQKTTEEKIMKKHQWMVPAAFAALTAATGAWAAEISNISGQSCGAFTGTWHFVNNQTGGAPQGTLTAAWDSGSSCTVTASKVLARVQHFYCTASGALTSASTDLPGRLVLSDFTCDIKPPPPPPCDPEKEKCEEPPK
jgi:hypothetical protein